MTTWIELHGVSTAADHGDAAGELATLRHAAALSVLPHIGGVLLTGSGARAWCGWLVPGGDQLRPGEGRQTLVLDEHGIVLADAWVIAEREQLWILADGLAPDTLLALCTQDCPDGVVVTATHPDHVVLSLDGPFAWEVMARFDSPGVIGLPPMTWYRTTDEVLCLRTSRTGEYAYLLLAPRGSVAELSADLAAAGAHLGLGRAGVTALGAAALENFCFWPHGEGRCGLGPLELQLQWRLPTEGEYRGAAAIRARRADGWRQRCTLFHAEAAAVGQPVHDDDERIGEVLRVEPWRHGGGVIGLALLDLARAHPGFTYDLPGGTLRTVTAPLVTNRSLFVRPQRHSWDDEGELPGLRPQDLG